MTSTRSVRAICRPLQRLPAERRGAAEPSGRAGALGEDGERMAKANRPEAAPDHLPKDDRPEANDDRNATGMRAFEIATNLSRSNMERFPSVGRRQSYLNKQRR